MSLFASWLASSPPDAAIEIAPESVSLAVLGSRGLGGSDPVVQAFAVAPLPPGAVTPSLSAVNIVDRAAVAQALRTACERAGQRPRRAALVIPDPAARVSLVRFDQVPARREDLEQLIRWQMKKSSPFPIEDACLTHSPGAVSGTGGEFVVVAARRETIREYESVCDEAGIYAGLVDLSTMSVVNLYLASDKPPAGDWLVVHMRPDYTSIAIMRGDDLIFFRNRVDGEAEALPDVIHQTTMYYQDRLAGQGFQRVLAGGFSRTPGEIEHVRKDLAARVGTTIESLDATRVASLADRVTASPDQVAVLAPLAGMLLRTRREAVPA
jgi:type IV pilus assembly protein PilM